MTKTILKSILFIFKLPVLIPIFVKRYMSHRIRKPTTYIGENKNADQLRSNCEADQRLCFRYTDSTIPLLPSSKFEVSSYHL